MKDQLMKAFVSKADGKFVRVKLLDSSYESELFDLGFLYNSDINEHVMQVDDNAAKAAIFEKLRDFGVSFSDGKEWCPSEVFEYLREIGLISGPFYRVSWRGPGDYHLTIE